MGFRGLIRRWPSIDLDSPCNKLFPASGGWTVSPTRSINDAGAGSKRVHPGEANLLHGTRNTLAAIGKTMQRGISIAARKARRPSRANRTDRDQQRQPRKLLEMNETGRVV
jgi:hypothetical protein